MKLINEDSYLLSTGKTIHPTRGIIGLTEIDNKFRIYEGYDGSWTIEDDLYEGCPLEAELTNEELQEIALHMSGLWLKWAKTLWQSHSA